MSAPVKQGELLAGKYRVDEVLGEGGMGVVVAATDIQLERRVALKFLLDAYTQHPEASSRFLREARAAAKIRSEHVARVIDVGTLESGSPYMVMEYLEGSDLAAVMAASTCLSIEDATDYILQACEAIAEAHARGIVHRDLKPANLFLSREPGGTAKVKVLDFGISKTTLAGGFEPALTKTTALMGSPLYMSPEQMRSTRSVDARTDIWALGIILYELLAQTPPFTGASVPELSVKVTLDPPPPLTEIRSDVPRELEAVIFKALAKDPNERYPSVAELAIALVAFAPKQARVTVENIIRILRAAGLSTSHLSLPPSVPVTPVASPPPAVTIRTGAETAASWGGTHGPEREGSVRRWIAAGLTALAVAGAVGALFVFWPWSATPIEPTTPSTASRGVGGPHSPAEPARPTPASQPTTASDLAPVGSVAPSSSSAANSLQADAGPNPHTAVAQPVRQPAVTTARKASAAAAPRTSTQNGTAKAAAPVTSVSKTSSRPSRKSSSALPEFGNRK